MSHSLAHTGSTLAVHYWQYTGSTLAVHMMRHGHAAWLAGPLVRRTVVSRDVLQCRWDGHELGDRHLQLHREPAWPMSAGRRPAGTAGYVQSKHSCHGPMHETRPSERPTLLLLTSLMSYSPAAVSALLQVMVLASVGLERRSRATHGCERRKSAARHSGHEVWQ